ncbi:reverse transcriptase domain-containing protein, partial [Tanacetum coccineum]
QGLDTAYWGFLGVGTTLDIFQNIRILYLEYGVLSLSGYGALSFTPLWSLMLFDVIKHESKWYVKPTLFAANLCGDGKPTSKLKDLLPHLEYAFLGNNLEFPVIISSLLSAKENELVLEVLAKHKRALAWKVTNIKGISPSFCTHKILMEDNFKPIVQPQRRLNLIVQDVVKAEIIKFLDAGLIYAISDCPWVSPIHVVPKKRGVTIVTNEDNEPAPTRTVNGWRVCIDYRKLNDLTRKYHFPLPFIDQILERLSRNEYYCFLDGFLGYFQIPLAPEDQQKTTFTSPYGTFAYRRMPFGLCNAPATFQWCMTAIFHDMCQDFMEVFMDDISVFGNFFDSCLNNLSMMLARCEETTLVLNWEKCHFIVREGIVLGHKISKAGIEVDKAKLEELDEDAIRDSFPGEHLMVINIKEAETDPWYADYANFLVLKIIPQYLTFHLRNKFMDDVKKYIWYDPYLFKSCPDGIPTIFKDSAMYVRECDACQKEGNISSRIQMPMTNILVSEVLDIWGIDFLGPFPSSQNNKYILVAVDYVSKCVEVEALLLGIIHS